jgi:hypothetical protein
MQIASKYCDVFILLASPKLVSLEVHQKQKLEGG